MTESWTSRLDDALGRHVDLRGVAPLRIVAGLLAAAHLWPFLVAAQDGATYRDVYHAPYWSAMPEIPDGVYLVVLWAGVAASLASSAGLFVRVSSAIAAGVVVGNLALSQTHYHHNRAFLAAILVALAFMPAGERLSLDRLRDAPVRHGPPGWGPAWPLTLLRLQVAVVYAASGVSKLLDPDWFGGVVTRLRVERDVDAVAGAGVPDWIVDIVRSEPFHIVFAKVTVATEIFIGLGLLHRRTRWVAVWLAIPFHVAIEMTADVQLFSYAALAALVIWVRMAPASRTLQVPGRFLRPVVRLFDWTGRLEVNEGPELLLVDDGRRLPGRDAVLRTLTLLPATFWFALPVFSWRERRLSRADQASPIRSASRS
jgi:hypothetical protein